jgi:hypothetical protein
MLKHALLCTGVVASVYVVSLSASGAAEYGTPEEAHAMLERAVASVKRDKLAAITSFNHNDLSFRDRDLFVFCFNGDDGRFTAHEAFVSRDVRELRDANGAPFGAELYYGAREGKITGIVYIAPVPGSTDLAVKSAYVTRIGDQVCGVSAYQVDGSGTLLTTVLP